VADDSVTFDLDAGALFETLTRLGDVAQPYVNEASRQTATAIVREAQDRLHRQLGPNATGATEAGITARPAYDGNGWVVVAENPRMPNLPFWIEKGTKKGKPGSHTMSARPYFYNAAFVEQGPALQRWQAALDAALEAVQG